MTVRVVLLAALLLTVANDHAYAQDDKLAPRAAMSRVKGSAQAPITVYEIADFQCPYCARFSREVFPRIDSAYVKTGKAQWIFVNMPLPTHAHSWVAAEAAMCAGGVGNQFWPMHDRIFLHQAEWAAAENPTRVFTQYAQDIGLPMDAYDACVRQDKLAAIIIRDLLNATGAGATGTPAFIISNEPIFAGYRDYDEWKGLLDAALKKATGSK